MSKTKQLLEFLKTKEPVWKDENHPELAQGAAAWVRELRAESDRSSRKRLQGKPSSKAQSK